ncbi:hypothetical protein TOPH_05849 [Tolypocladium ophioglossoides CBS 100239]|uniref:C2H2-type domain-containing protein n=1 Tax=Tolypocladium ophioglossoides (strain CBS 100239) TaxID=1163406 RepID=A0A0L0N653_TOLOC|nr:hypothetical protein TOPH_05849 [Tolypocladium ophioglossoides CBS 100239]
MSAVAIQFDPTFTMGARSAFTWPGHLESVPSSSNSVLGTDLNSIVSGSEPSLTPPSETRSLASSPPRGAFTPEQQELNRQRDRARRDSKLSARIRHVDSNPYTTSPPMTMADVSNAINLPVYSTTAPSAVPLIAPPATTLSSHAYLPPYNLALQEQSHGGQMFTPSPYQQPLQHSYGVSMEYPTAYAGPGEYSTRTPSLSISQDSGMMYQMAGVTTSSNASTQEGSHVRVVQSRPKPRCWEHGCNGRQFSTFSNLLRHQREKSGQAAKATCPNCGAEFTRTTARNGHLLHDKCKQRRNT